MAIVQKPVVKSTALTGSDQNVKTIPCTYRGFAICETGGSTAHVRIYDHASANSGTLLDSIKLVSGESVGVNYEPGREAALGIRVDIVSGTVEGTVFWSVA